MAEIIAGRNNVLAALEAGRSLTKIYIAEGSRNNYQPLFKLATEMGCPWQFVPRKKLDELAQGINHQGIVAEGAPWKYCVNLHPI